jgi:hypothetical protein
MMRRLTKLRIDEVSSCLKGAGEGTRVLLRKSYDRTSHHQRLQKLFGSIPYSKLKFATPPSGDDDDIDDTELDTDTDDASLPGRMEQFITALQTANPNLSREDAVAYLIHSAHGRSAAEHMSSTFKRKEHPMTDRATELRKIAKDYGVARIAKMIVMENDAHGISEFELTELASEEFAKQKLPGERPNTTFARLYDAPENLELRKAFQIAKNTPAPLMSLEPVQVGGNDAQDINACELDNSGERGRCSSAIAVS